MPVDAQPPPRFLFTRLHSYAMNAPVASGTGVPMLTALRASAAAAAIIYAGLMSSLQASPTCPDEQPTAQLPQDLKLCRDLEPVVRNPGGLPLDQYEAQRSEERTSELQSRFGISYA